MRYVIALGVLATVLQMTPNFGQAPDPQPPGAAVPPDQRMRGESDGSTVDAVLDKSLHVKKNKPNDQRGSENQKQNGEKYQTTDTRDGRWTGSYIKKK